MAAAPKVKILPVTVKGQRRFRWQLVANGNVIATDHGQGYNKRHRAREMALRVVRGDYADATVEEG